MKLLGWTITRHKAVEKALQPVDDHGGWLNLIREPFAGAWQRNLEIQHYQCSPIPLSSPASR